MEEDFSWKRTSKKESDQDIKQRRNKEKRTKKTNKKKVGRLKTSNSKLLETEINL